MAEQTTERKKRKGLRIGILCAVLLVVLVGAAIGGRYVYRILKQPESFFGDETVELILRHTAGRETVRLFSCANASCGRGRSGG